MTRTRVGIIGATGMVGQNYLRLLNGQPWFQVTHVSASPRSAGKTYAEAVAGRWVMDEPIPAGISDPAVGAAADVETAVDTCDFVFSALGMDKEAVRELEETHAAAGLPVASNNSAHRHTDDVPMLMPEINPHHTDIIPIQRQNRGWDTGFIAVKPNCSLQSYLPPVYALTRVGYPVESIVVTTLQAVSGAGYPGVPPRRRRQRRPLHRRGGGEDRAGAAEVPRSHRGWRVRLRRLADHLRPLQSGPRHRRPHRLRQPPVPGPRTVAGGDHRHLARLRGAAPAVWSPLRARTPHRLPGGAGPPSAVQGPGHRQRHDHRRGPSARVPGDGRPLRRPVSQHPPGSRRRRHLERRAPQGPGIYRVIQRISSSCPFIFRD